MESFCLPILLYSIVAFDLNVTQIAELNAVATLYRRIFGFNKWESVKSFIWGLGRLDFKSIRCFLCVKFYKSGLVSGNNVFRCITQRRLLTNEIKQLWSSLDLNIVDFDSLCKLPAGFIRKQIALSFVNSI